MATQDIGVLALRRLQTGIGKVFSKILRKVLPVLPYGLMSCVAGGFQALIHARRPEASDKSGKVGPSVRCRQF